MKPYYEHGGIRLHHGDCLSVMAELEPESVSAVVTDPPYGLEFMGKEWDHGVPGEPFWREALRVTKPGGILLAFGGTRTYHRLACAIEDAGWEIRDCLSWLYGSGFPKSLDVSKAIDKAKGAERDVVGTKLGRPGYADTENTGRMLPGSPGATAGYLDETAPATDLARLWSGYGTALKPAWEPIVLAMKPLDGTFAGNAERHGVAGVNVDGCRVDGPGAEAGRTRHGGGIPGNGTSYELPDSRGAMPSGRFPANLALDEEAARMLDEQSGDLDGGKPRTGTPGGHTFGGSVNEHNTAGVGSWPGGSGGASRFFYTAKASKADRGAHNDHPTVKPVSLMRWLVRMVTMPEGTVILDPFAGSGTTPYACREEHVRCIAIEQDEHNCKIAVKRLAQEVFDFTGGTP